MIDRTFVRRLPVGAEVSSEGVSFRVWAPTRQQVDVVLDGGRMAPLAHEPDDPDGYWSALIPGIGAGGAVPVSARRGRRVPRSRVARAT